MKEHASETFTESSEAVHFMKKNCFDLQNDGTWASTMGIFSGNFVYFGVSMHATFSEEFFVVFMSSQMRRAWDWNIFAYNLPSNFKP